jgi:hypothetical protein
VPAVEVDEPVLRELTKPEVERDRLRREVIVEPAVCLGKSVLNDVGRVQTGGHPRVDADGHHAAKSATVTIEQLTASHVFSTFRTGQQLVRLLVRTPYHDASNADPAIARRI